MRTEAAHGFADEVMRCNDDFIKTDAGIKKKSKKNF